MNLFWFQFLCVISLSWSYKLRPLTNQKVNRNSFSKCSASAQLPTEKENDQNLLQNIRTLGRLKEERELKRKEMIAANLAAEQADTVYKDFRDNNRVFNSAYPKRTSGTYNYGFTSQSNDVLLQDKKNGLGNSIPSGAIILAFTNFKRELGRE
jgi:hypothetical protein